MSNIKIVTAFFDIGRKDFEKFPRSNQQYFDYFKFWARIQNELVVYCAPENVDVIIKIRQNYGLADKTTVIPIDDVFSIEPKMYQKMLEIENDVSFQDFRYRYHDPTNYADYDYIVLLKTYFMNEVAKRSKDYDYIAWIDFGFNHGGEVYTCSDDFDFLWDEDFPQKVRLFCLNDPQKLSLIDSLQFQYDCVMGCTIVSPKSLCSTLWESNKRAMLSLIDNGVIDDDQHIMLMAYKMDTEMFYIKIGNWFADFQHLGFSVYCSKKQPQKPNENHKSKSNNIIKKIIRKSKWCYKRITDPSYPKANKSSFIERMENKEKKYYG